MMDYSHGKIVFECDGCTEVFETDSKDFSDAKLKLDAEGWKAIKVGSIWEHECAKCLRLRGK